MPIDSISPYFSPIRKKIEMFYQSARGLSLSKLELALGYVMGIHEIDQILVGINTVSQLQEVIKATQVQINPIEFRHLSIDNKVYTNPSLWKI